MSFLKHFFSYDQDSLSKSIFLVLRNNSKSFWGKFFGNSLFWLIFLNVIAAVLETLPSLHGYSQYFFYFEVFSLGVFFVEYFLRILVSFHDSRYAGTWGRLKFVFSPIMLFDAFVLFPGIFSVFFPALFSLSELRIFRVFRIFRLGNYSDSLWRILGIINIHRKNIVSSFLFVFISVFSLSCLMYYAEKDIQPEVFTSIPDALYWGLVTTSTIGYGDIIAQSDLGKVITSFAAVFGVALYSLPSALLGAAFYAEAQSKEATHVKKLEEEVSLLRKKIKKLKEKESSLERREDKEKDDNLTKEKEWSVLKWIRG